MFIFVHIEYLFQVQWRGPVWRGRVQRAAGHGLPRAGQVQGGPAALQYSTVQYSTQYRYREDQLQPPDAEVAATVESFSLHPSYVARDLLGTDVAVLRLKQALQFSHKVRPICLPSDPEETHDNKEQCFKKVHPKDRNHGEGPY